MAEEHDSDNPFVEATPAEPDRLNAPLPSVVTAAAAPGPPSYTDAVQSQSA